MARVLFIQNLFMEQLGVMSLSAVLKANGHDVRLAIGSDTEIIETAKEYKPHIVGVTVLTGFQKRWARLAIAIKEALKEKPLVVFGGPHPTFFPEIALAEGVDAVCRGEGEGAIVELAGACDAHLNEDTLLEAMSKIRNLCFGVPTSSGKQKLVVNPMRRLEDVDRLPYADREISFSYRFVREDPNVHFLAGRGCPYSCSFCFNKKMRELCDGLGPTVRMRNPQNVIDEIVQVRRRWGIKVVYFQDDTFILNRRWLLQFLDEYRRSIRLPLYCTVRADLVTEEIAFALKEAGCYRVSFGVESGVEKIRNEVLQKKITNDDIKRTAKILKKAGLTFQTTNMMGLPGETLDDAIQTLKLNIEIGTDVAWTSIYQPYPGTELGEKTFKDGYIKDFPDDETIADAHTSSVLNQPEIAQVERLQKLVYLAVKFPKLLPFTKQLTTLNMPRLFYWVHRITYLLFYFRKITKMSLKRTIEEALTAFKYYHPEKGTPSSGQFHSNNP